MKTIVISAVNIVEAGPLVILRDCLSYLSHLAQEEEVNVIAIVNNRCLAEYPNIEYIEDPWPKKNWINRLWYEYISLKRISKEIGPISLWFSLHDTTPSVICERQAVYCHNAFSFYDWKLHDLFFAPKIALFALFTKYIYRTNIRRNSFLVVQQYWFRERMSTMFSFPSNRIIVSPPQLNFLPQECLTVGNTEMNSFLYPGSPNSHKNFEVLCRAVSILEKDRGLPAFKVYITVRGDENKYARWLYRNWKHLDSLVFIGFLSREELVEYYAKCGCLVFASKSETWGLPISEYASYQGYMLLADRPYARESAGGASQVAFFDPDEPRKLAELMKCVILGESAVFEAIDKEEVVQPFENNWEGIFKHIM